MSFRALDTMLRDHGLTVSYAGPGLLRVRGTVSVAGHPFPVSATAQVRVEGEDLVLSPRDISSGDASSIVGDALLSVIRDRLTLRLPLSALPFHVRLVSVQVAKDGVRVSARSDGFVLNIG
jgi:hypothetical protein